MATIFQSGKLIVAAASFAVGFSLPLGAETIDEMFDALQSAESGEAALIEERILNEWSKSGSAAMDLLLQRGMEAIEVDDLRAAVEHLTAAIDHDPDFAEAYAQRAVAYYLQGYMGPALDDLRQALVLNPRQFYALYGFAVILEEVGQPEHALEIYEQIAEIHPHMEQVNGSIGRLRLDLAGQPI